MNKKLSLFHLYEMATVGWDDDLSIIVEVNPDTRRIGNEYFKVYNSASYRKATKECRILFDKPEYVIHRNENGKQNWIMNSKERKNLVWFLNQPSDVFPELSIWKTAIVLFNREKGLKKSQTMENFVDNRKYPDFLPIDLPMPNYTLLK